MNRDKKLASRKIRRLLKFDRTPHIGRINLKRHFHGLFGNQCRVIPGRIMAFVLTLLCLCFAVACQPVRQVEWNVQGDQVPDPLMESANDNRTRMVQADETEKLKQQVRGWAADWLKELREPVAPRVFLGAGRTRGTWTEQAADTNDAQAAAKAFLLVANPLFRLDYQSGDMTARFYQDDTGFRSDLWRMESHDGHLVGAVAGDTLAFVSADCAAEPGDAVHPSMEGIRTVASQEDLHPDVTALAVRVANAFHTSVTDV